MVIELLIASHLQEKKKTHTLSMNVDNPFTLDIPSHGFALLIPSNYFGYPEVKYDAAQLDVFRNHPGQSVGLVGPSGGGARQRGLFFFFVFVRGKILYETYWFYSIKNMI